MDSQHDGTEGCGEDSREKKAQAAMGQLSLQDQPLPTNSQLVQQKLAEMKELLKNLNDSQILENTRFRYYNCENDSSCLEERLKLVEALNAFVTNYYMYRCELMTNIDKIEKSQFVVLSELLPLHEAPKYVDFDEIKEAFRAENMNE